MVNPANVGKCFFTNLKGHGTKQKSCQILKDNMVSIFFIHFLIIVITEQKVNPQKNRKYTMLLFSVFLTKLFNFFFNLPNVIEWFISIFSNMQRNFYYINFVNKLKF